MCCSFLKVCRYQAAAHFCRAFSSPAFSLYYYSFFFFKIIKKKKKRAKVCRHPENPMIPRPQGTLTLKKVCRFFCTLLGKTCTVFKKVCRFGPARFSKKCAGLSSKKCAAAFLPAHFCLIIMSETPQDRMPKGSYRPFCMSDNRADEGVGRVNIRPSTLPFCAKQP